MSVVYAGLPPSGSPPAFPLVLATYFGVLAATCLVIGALAPRNGWVVLVAGAVFALLAVLCGRAGAASLSRRRADRRQRDERLRASGFLIGEISDPRLTRSSPLPDDPDVISWIVERSRMPLMGAPGVRHVTPLIAYARFRRRLARHGLPLPRTIIDHRARAAIAGIPVAADMLEPEFIPMVPRQAHALGVLLAVFAATGMSLARSVGYPWVGMILIGTGLVVAVLMIARFRQRTLLMHLFEQFSPIAGLGVVRDQQRRRWEAGEAVLIVQCDVRGTTLRATLFGPPGTLRWSFPSSDHPDFRALWVRWNHPNPRPDLLD